jgi:hypothetical protein
MPSGHSILQNKNKEYSTLILKNQTLNRFLKKVPYYEMHCKRPVQRLESHGYTVNVKYRVFKKHASLKCMPLWNE